jgi:hypothetical protein
MLLRVMKYCRRQAMEAVESRTAALTTAVDSSADVTPDTFDTAVSLAVSEVSLSFRRRDRHTVLRHNVTGGCTSES